MRGSNLPRFRALQHDFAAHIRHPDRNPPPAGIPSRRMDVYVGLVYQNIENFLARTFRVARGLISDAHWNAMVRDFIHRHVSGSPYFLQIPEEFLVYLESERDTSGDAPFCWSCATMSGWCWRSTCRTLSRLASVRKARLSTVLSYFRRLRGRCAIASPWTR